MKKERPTKKQAVGIVPPPAGPSTGIVGQRPKVIPSKDAPAAPKKGSKKS